tara:strand:+ start:1574 stop:3268 length:1695 start_codon:yes stop_codon:yes gene_type:complete
MDDATALQLCLERDRLLSDPEFARSPSMCKLLRFLVDYKLSGNSVPLKSYSIAVDALGRDADFDPQADSYPRVQMGRLRRMLDNFYLRKGGENRLTIAPNQYAIVVEPNVQPSGKRAGPSARSPQSDTRDGATDQSAESQSPAKDGRDRPDSTRRYLGAFGLAIVAMLAAVLAYFLWLDPDAGHLADEIAYPRIALDLPVTATGTHENELAESIGNHLVRGLNGFGGIRVFDIKAGPPKKSGYLIKLHFLDAEAGAIELRLLNRDSGEILWSREISTSEESTWKREVDQAIISLVGNYGEIAQAEISKLENDFSAGYPCLLQFDLYVRYREQEKLQPLRACMQKSVKHFPRDAYLLSVAALASNMAEQTAPNMSVTGRGMLLARRAEALDHDSAAANFAIAQSAFFAGDCETGVAWGKKAVALNPLNSRISGYLGLYMIACNLPEGESYAARALEFDPNADLTIAAAVAFQMLKRGDAVAARALSARYMASSLRNEPGLELTYILSSAMLKDQVEARRAWKVLAERYGLSGSTPPREVLSRWISSPALLDDVMRMVDRSGLFRA